MHHYPRKAHFDYFRSLSYPYVGVTAEQDVTDAYRYSKGMGKSFYLMILHAVALAWRRDTSSSVELFRESLQKVFQNKK